MNIKGSTNAMLIAAGTLALAGLWYVSLGPGAPEQINAGAWYVLYTALAAAGAILLAAPWLPPALKTAVVSLAVAVVAAIYAAEFVLAWGLIAKSTPVWNVDRTSPQRARELAAARAQGVAIDLRSPAAVLTGFRDRQIDAVPAVMIADVLRLPDTGKPVGAALGTLLPLGSIARAHTLLCNESGDYVSYHSDEHGFRNPPGIWDAPHADLAAVGQSLTQGYCVQDGRGFVDLLRARHPVTLNLGMSGDSAILQLGAIREYLPRYAPKVVLWFFTEGIDLADLYEESTHPLAVRYLEPEFSQRLLGRQSEIDTGLRHFVADRESQMRDTGADASSRQWRDFIEQSLGRLKLWDLREKLELLYGFTSDAQPWSMARPPIRTLLSQTLTQSQAVVRGWGGNLYFVYLPSWERYRNGPRVPERERTSVLTLVEGLGIPIVDVQAAFQAHPDPLSLFPFRRFGHYNDAGNQVVADTILKSLSGNERPQSSILPSADR